MMLPLDTLLLAVLPTVLGSAPVAQESARADDTARGDMSTTIVVTDEQVAAVDRGLVWLAEHQSADGSWVAKIGYKLNNDFKYTADDKGHLGVTSLACMAFLAGG